ncbi:hypothetical protein J6590_102964 [Homalodisca vitripennis]|nr:hypothetical protein J6590_102964 [Homalodisca vitripennis]
MTEHVNKRGEAKEKPLPIVQYNQYMSGIDGQDQLLSYYPCERKTIRRRYVQCRDKDCGSTAIFREGEAAEIRPSPHNHPPPDEVEVEVLRFKADLKQRALNERRLTSREVFNAVCIKLRKIESSQWLDYRRISNGILHVGPTRRAYRRQDSAIHVASEQLMLGQCNVAQFLDRMSHCTRRLQERLGPRRVAAQERQPAAPVMPPC